MYSKTVAGKETTIVVAEWTRETNDAEADRKRNNDQRMVAQNEKEDVAVQIVTAKKNLLDCGKKKSNNWLCWVKDFAGCRWVLIKDREKVTIGGVEFERVRHWKVPNTCKTMFRNWREETIEPVGRWIVPCLSKIESDNWRRGTGEWVRREGVPSKSKKLT